VGTRRQIYTYNDERVTVKPDPNSPGVLPLIEGPHFLPTTLKYVAAGSILMITLPTYGRCTALFYIVN
jgi:hypothetical protein